LYITRCAITFRPPNTVNTLALAADIVGALKTDIKDAIKASWSKTRAGDSDTGLENFENIWLKPFKDDYFASIHTNSHIDPTTSEPGPYYGSRSLRLSNF
jgi:hypothetical protein